MIRCGQDRNLHEGGFPGSEPLKTGLLRDRIGGCYRSSTPGGVINPIPRWIRGGSNHQMSSRLSPWGLHRLGSRRRLGRRPSQARTPFPSKGRGRGTGRRYCFRFRLMAHATREFERLTIGRKARRSRYLHARSSWRMVHLDHMLIQSSLRWPFGFVLLLQSPNSKLVKPLGKSDNLDRLGLALSES